MSTPQAVSKFYQWLASEYPDVRLLPKQADLVNAFFAIGARGSGKTLVLNLLHEYDLQGSPITSELSTTHPTDTLDAFIDCIDTQSPLLMEEYRQTLANLAEPDFVALFKNKYPPQT